MKQKQPKTDPATALLTVEVLGETVTLACRPARSDMYACPGRECWQVLRRKSNLLSTGAFPFRIERFGGQEEIQVSVARSMRNRGGWVYDGRLVAQEDL